MARAIDAEEFMKNFDKEIENGATDVFDAVENALEETPTIEAEPVKHGHWNLVSRKNIWDDLVDVFECSECKKYTTNGRGNTSPTDFCPNCGARMNKGE